MIRIVEDQIDFDEVIQAVSSQSAGALVTFDGRVRELSRGKRVTHLYYEVYEEMALRELEALREEVLEKWPVSNVAIVHRVGRLEIGESSVVIAVSSPHRREAFEACRYLIDTLKTRVPIWKKESYEDGETWIEGPEQDLSSG